MVNDYILALKQLGDPRLWKPVIWATIFSLFSLVLLVFLSTGVTGLIFDFIFSYFDSYEKDSWLRIGVQSIVFVFLCLLGFFFFGSLQAAFLGLYIDDVIDAVHNKHYPTTSLRPPPKVISSIIISVRLVGLSFLVNFLAAPLFFLGWFFPPLGMAMQVIVNGFLLGREYKTVLRERLSEENYKPSQSFTQHGAIGSALFMVPALNFVAPLLICVSIQHAMMKQKN